MCISFITRKPDKDKIPKTRECLICNDEWLVNKDKVSKEFF